MATAEQRERSRAWQGFKRQYGGGRESQAAFNAFFRNHQEAQAKKTAAKAAEAAQKRGFDTLWNRGNGDAWVDYALRRTGFKKDQQAPNVTGRQNGDRGFVLLDNSNTPVPHEPTLGRTLPGQIAEHLAFAGASKVTEKVTVKLKHPGADVVPAYQRVIAAVNKHWPDRAQGLATNQTLNTVAKFQSKAVETSVNGLNYVWGNARGLLGMENPAVLLIPKEAPAMVIDVVLKTEAVLAARAIDTVGRMQNGVDAVVGFFQGMFPKQPESPKSQMRQNMVAQAMHA